MLRVQVASLYVKMLAGKPNLTREEFDRADTVLRLLRSPAASLPVEAHYVAMLLVTLDAKATMDLVQTALRVRQLAEQASLGAVADTRGSGFLKRDMAHPYSEWVFPVVRDKIMRADQHRLHGEDLLLASQSTSWKEASEDFKKAESLYNDAAKDAIVLREALQVRDEVLAVLPYYSQWLAGQRLSGDRQTLEDMLKQAEQLWQQVHVLRARLQKLDGKGIHEPLGADEDDPRSQSLKILSKNVWNGFQDLKGKFNERCKVLHGERQHSDWHALEAALAIPLIEDANLRMTMLNNSRATSSQLLSSESKPAAKPLDAEVLAKTARLDAQRQGRMMVAVLGAGQKWRQMLDDIGKALNASLERKDLREAASDLIVAEDLCRLVDGGTAALVPDKPFDPVEGSRRLRVLNLLVGQMNRTLNDHYWSAEKNNPGASPYYLGCGQCLRRLCQTTDGSGE